MKTLFKNARILKMDGSPIFFGDLVVDGSTISYIGPKGTDDGAYDQVYECNGNLLMPGFKNAHTHSAMTFVRSKADDLPLMEWLRQIIFPREALITEDDVYKLSKLAFLEYLTSGITACFDQYYYPWMIGKAAEEIGMRTVLLGTYNCTAEDPVKTMVNFYNSFNNGEGRLVSYTLGIHAEYTTSDAELKAMKEALDITGSKYFLHICETQREVDECKARRNGMTPVQFMDSLDLFENGGGGNHCVYFEEADIEIFKKKNLSVVTCPGSNAKLASGIAPIARFLKEGINVAIGTDGPASNNSLDMFKEMTLLYSLQNLVNNQSGVISTYDILKMATVNGAKAMGLNDCDTLEVGKKADLIVIDLNRPNMQPINNIVSNLVYAGSKENVKLTMINGKVLYHNGKFFIGQEVESIYQECQEITDRLDREIKEKQN